jgi:hypothetical protein
MKNIGVQKTHLDKKHRDAENAQPFGKLRINGSVKLTTRAAPLQEQRRKAGAASSARTKAPVWAHAGNTGPDIDLFVRMGDGDWLGLMR